MGDGDFREQIEAVEAFVARLHKALRLYASYPASNPLCEDAARDCHAALRAATTSRSLTIDVGHDEILWEGDPLLAEQRIGSEFAALFHRLSIGTILVEAHATVREVGAFCEQLAAWEQRRDDRPTTGQPPTLHACPGIRIERLQRLRVLDARELSDSRLMLAAHYGRSGGEEGTSVDGGGYLYAAGRAWVLVDSTSDISRISMVDLAFVLDDPPAFAAVLEQLASSEDAPDISQSAAFERNFREIAGLFAVLDGSLKERMLARLASSLLQLPPDRRHRLLTDHVVPSLIDGRSDAAVLRHLPDGELAGALAMTHRSRGTTETLGRAIEHLDLPPERSDRLFDLTMDKLRETGSDDTEDLAPGQIRGLDGQTITLERDGVRDLRRFEAYDLSMNAAMEARLGEVGTAIDGSDGNTERLRCIGNVLWRATSGEAAEVLLAQVFAVFAELNRSRRWLDVAQWTLRFMSMAQADGTLDPKVQEALKKGLGGMCSVPLVVGLLGNAARDDAESRAALEKLVASLPHNATEVLVELLRQRIDPPSVIDLMSRNATQFAESIRAYLNDDDAFVVRSLLRILGSADAGYEMLVAAKMRHPDSMVAREAYRALAHMRTPKAVALVGDRLRKGDPLEKRLAAATLVKFQAKMADQIALGALRQEKFVRGDPTLAALLLKNVHARSGAQLGAILERLARYRFHIWRPDLARLGRQARALRAA
jgi:hypothetical protein